MKTLLVTGSDVSEEVVSLAEAKEFLRVRYNVEDTTIQTLIQSARSACERVGRISITQKTFLTAFRPPTGSRVAFFTAANVSDPDNVLTKGFRVPRRPLREVDFIKYVNTGDDDFEYDANDYVVDTDLARAEFKAFPTISGSLTSVFKVQYSAGFDTPDDDPVLHPLPPDIKDAILQTLAYQWENRGDTGGLPGTALATMGNYWRPYTV